MKFDEIWWILMNLDEFWWSFMKFEEENLCNLVTFLWRNFKFDEITRNFLMKFDEIFDIILWNLMKLKKKFWCHFMKFWTIFLMSFDEIWWNIWCNLIKQFDEIRRIFLKNLKFWRNFFWWNHHQILMKSLWY